MAVSSSRHVASVLVFTLAVSAVGAAHAQEAADDFRALKREPAAAPAPAPAPAPPANVTPPAAQSAAAAQAQSAAASRPDGVQPTPSQPGPQLPERPKNTWDLTPFGYLRAGYDHTMKDDRYAFVGRNNGFVLESARIGMDGRADAWNIAWRASIEGASDVLSAPNTPQGTLSVRLRDAFARWDPVEWLGVQVGQFKAPFQEEELRGTNTLLFASRAVGVEGIPPGRGFETPGLQLDRQLGVMLSPAKPIGGDVAASYYVMLMNGNGSNQLLDDNGRFGIVGRTELGIFEYVRLGAGVFRNDRTVGIPPNLYTEEDFGLTGDVFVTVAGLQVFGAVTRVRTVFATVGASAREQLAFHGQAGYRFDLPGWFIGPAYRYAYFHPWQAGGAQGFDAFKVVHHTFGVRAGLAKLPLQAWLNYTATVEEDGRKLDNDRIELLGQVTF